MNLECLLKMVATDSAEGLSLLSRNFACPSVEAAGCSFDSRGVAFENAVAAAVAASIASETGQAVDLAWCGWNPVCAYLNSGNLLFVFHKKVTYPCDGGKCCFWGSAEKK